MEKKEELKTAHEIVIDSFFTFLNESGKTMKEYASYNNIDELLYQSGEVVLHL